jgi:hypothetical protein
LINNFAQPIGRINFTLAATARDSLLDSFFMQQLKIADSFSKLKKNIAVDDFS